MNTGITFPTSKLRSLLAVTDAYRRSILRRRSLPPGKLVQLDNVERKNRKILLELAATHGPVFKTLSLDRLCICIVGLKRGRRLLKEHATALRPVTLDLREMFPEGFMRQMEGGCHRRYRDMLNRGVNMLNVDDMSDDLTSIASDGLAAIAQEMESRNAAPHEYASVLNGIASGMLLRVFFGALSGTQQFNQLLENYHRLGPHGIVWNITSTQTEAFAALREELRALLKTPNDAFNSGLLGRLAGLGEIDDIMLGNLIYMVEMGRYDLRALFRWISKYAADNPDWIERIAGEDKHESTSDTRSAAEAFVVETLRMDQSERLLRNVKQDIEFDGFVIPQGALVRVCMWESHKDKEAFPDPFDFNPARFLSTRHTIDHFSPFGLDHHQCPFSAISISLGVVFLCALASRYHISAIGDGPAVRGAYHWEPTPRFSVDLKVRDEAEVN